MPHEIIIGAGAVILGEGLVDGRPAVILRPAAGPDKTPPVFDAAGLYTPLDGDTILWIDGHPDVLIRALASAAAHHLPKD